MSEKNIGTIAFVDSRCVRNYEDNIKSVCEWSCVYPVSCCEFGPFHGLCELKKIHWLATFFISTKPQSCTIIPRKNILVNISIEILLVFPCVTFSGLYFYLLALFLPELKTSYSYQGGGQIQVKIIIFAHVSRLINPIS